MATKRIQKESLKDRRMDKSPNVLSEELGWTTNTIRSRIDALELTRTVTKPVRNLRTDEYEEVKIEQSAFVIAENGYQLYNHECLPILYAYLGKKGNLFPPQDKEMFYQKIMTELNDDPDQKVCRTYLYAQDDFRQYYVQSKLSGAIQQRLKCIEALSKNLDVYPAEQSVAPFAASSAIETIVHLDKMIYQLSNYIPTDSRYHSCEGEPSSAKDTPTVKEGKLDTEQTDLVIKASVQKWCMDLLELREAIYEGDLTITIPPNATDNLHAVELLMYKELDDQSKSIANRVVEQVDKTIETIQTFTHTPDDIHLEVEQALRFNMGKYLEALFDLKPIPDFEMPLDTKLSPFLTEIVKETYLLMRYAAETIEKNFSALNLWCTLNIVYAECYDLKNPKPRPEDSPSFSSACNRLHNFTQGIKENTISLWEAISGKGCLSLNQSDFETMSKLIKDTNMTPKKFPLSDRHDDVLKYLRAVMKKDDVPPSMDLMLLGAAVSVECYWEHFIKEYVKFIVSLNTEYQNTIKPFIDT